MMYYRLLGPPGGTLAAWRSGTRFGRRTGRRSSSWCCLFPRILGHSPLPALIRCLAALASIIRAQGERAGAPHRVLTTHNRDTQSQYPVGLRAPPALHRL